MTGTPADVVLEARRLTKHFRVRSRPARGHPGDRPVGQPAAVVFSGNLRPPRTDEPVRMRPLERPDDGDVMIEGHPCGSLSDDARTAIRRSYLGFVYQFHHLLPEFSALENVMLPQMIAGQSRRAARKRAAELLAIMGLEGRASHRPARLSGGEQQRVAIARAVANGPRILLADEPTGNLDHHTADAVFAQLFTLVRDSGLAALIATHNLELARRMDRVLELRDGTIFSAALS